MGVNPSDALRRGHLLREFAVPRDGLVSHFRSRSPLLLVFGRSEDIAELVEQIADADELHDAELRTLIVLRGPAAPAGRRVTVVCDDGSVLAALTRQNSGQDPRWLVCLTDRFGEIFFAAVGSRGDCLPRLEQLTGWSDFLARSCEECFPPEWPVL